MSKKFIPYGRQWIDEDDIEAVVSVLKSDYLTQGPKVGEFEKALVDYCEAKYAVVFNSGTSALHGAYFVLGLLEKDEVITTPITFVATSNAILYVGAKPVFADIEKDSANIDPLNLEKHITKNTKAISIVHYAGHPVDMEPIKNIAKKYNLKIIEDACHALGAKYKGEKIGSCKYSDMTIFSFHPVKHITTGEGGAVLTNDENLYHKLIMFRSHGITKDNDKFLKNSDGKWYYEMQILGYNYRLTDIQASLGISQLKKLDFFVKRRREIAKTYNDAFKDNQYFDLPVEKDYAYHSYHLYNIRLKAKYLDKKDQIVDLLTKLGIGVQVHYIPVYWHPFYQELGYNKGACPNAEEYYASELSLPMYPAMSDEDVSYVIEKVFEAFKKI